MNTNDTEEEKPHYLIKILPLLGGLFIILSLFGAVYGFTRPSFCHSFHLTSETGYIGDTIGGITAPILNFLNAVLLFYSFREQYKANNLQKYTLEKEVKRIEAEKQFDRIYSILNDISIEINNLTFYTQTNDSNITTQLNGLKTIPICAKEIYYFMNVKEQTKIGLFLSEIHSILKTVEFGLEKINSYKYGDKLFLYQRFKVFYDTKLKDVLTIQNKLAETAAFYRETPSANQDGRIEFINGWHTAINGSIQAIDNLCSQIEEK